MAKKTLTSVIITGLVTVEDDAKEFKIIARSLSSDFVVTGTVSAKKKSESELHFDQAGPLILEVPVSETISYTASLITKAGRESNLASFEKKVGKTATSPASLTFTPLTNKVEVRTTDFSDTAFNEWIVKQREFPGFFSVLAVDGTNKNLVRISGITVTINQLAGKKIKCFDTGEERTILSNTATSSGLTDIITTLAWSVNPSITIPHKIVFQTIVNFNTDKINYTTEKSLPLTVSTQLNEDLFFWVRRVDIYGNRSNFYPLATTGDPLINGSYNALKSVVALYIQCAVSVVKVSALNTLIDPIADFTMTANFTNKALYPNLYYKWFTKTDAESSWTLISGSNYDNITIAIAKYTEQTGSPLVDTIKQKRTYRVEAYKTVSDTTLMDFDEFTVTKLVDNNAYSPVLTNENHSIPATTAGVVVSGDLDPAYTLMRIYQGLKDISDKFTYSITYTATGLTASFITGDSGITNKCKISACTDPFNAGTIDCKATLIADGTITFTKTFTVSKVKQGITGIDSYNIINTNSFENIMCLDNGTPSPAVSAAPVATSVRLYKGTTLQTAFISCTSSNTTIIPANNIVISNNSTTNPIVTVNYLNPGSSYLSAIVTINVYLNSDQNTLIGTTTFTLKKNIGRSVTLVSTAQTVTSDKSGSTWTDASIAPSSFTLSAIASASFSSPTYAWYYGNNGADPTNLISAQTSAVWTPTASTYLSGTNTAVTFKVVVTDTNGSAYDFTDIKKLANGTNGTPGNPGNNGDSVSMEYSADGSNWHATYVPASDIYMRTKTVAGVGGAITYSSTMSIAGPNGTALESKGTYNASTTYYYTLGLRRAVVEYSGTKYYMTVPGTVTGAWNASLWTAITGFTMVATDLLLAQDINVDRNLTLATGGRMQNIVSSEISYTDSTNSSINIPTSTGIDIIMQSVVNFPTGGTNYAMVENNTGFHIFSYVTADVANHKLTTCISLMGAVIPVNIGDTVASLTSYGKAYNFGGSPQVISSSSLTGYLNLNTNIYSNADFSPLGGIAYAYIGGIVNAFSYQSKTTSPDRINEIRSLTGADITVPDYTLILPFGSVNVMDRKGLRILGGTIKGARIYGGQLINASGSGATLKQVTIQNGQLLIENNTADWTSPAIEVRYVSGANLYNGKINMASDGMLLKNSSKIDSGVATAYSDTTNLWDTSKSWTVDALIDCYCVIYGSTYRGAALITDNTSNHLYLGSGISALDPGFRYEILPANYKTASLFSLRYNDLYDAKVLDLSLSSGKLNGEHIMRWRGLNATAPTTAQEGDMYFNSTNNCIKVYHSSSWIEMTL